MQVITLPDHDVCIYAPPGGVYGILAAPPCTEFSLAKNGSHRKRDLDAGMEVVKACLRIIWHCQAHGKLQFWALENPVGLLRRFLGKPAYTFYQWWFADLGIKRTDLWGQFNEPKQQVFERPDVAKTTNSMTKAFSDPVCPAEHKEYVKQFDTPIKRRAALRAITPQGFAEAFYLANK